MILIYLYGIYIFVINIISLFYWCRFHCYVCYSCQPGCGLLSDPWVSLPSWRKRWTFWIYWKTTQREWAYGNCDSWGSRAGSSFRELSKYGLEGCFGKQATTRCWAMAISEDQGISCEMKNLLKFLSILDLNFFYLIGLWLKHGHVIYVHIMDV